MKWLIFVLPFAAASSLLNALDALSARGNGELSDTAWMPSAEAPSHMSTLRKDTKVTKMRYGPYVIPGAQVILKLETRLRTSNTRVPFLREKRVQFLQ